MFESQQEREQNDVHRSGVFIVNFEHISHHVLMFLLLAYFPPCSSVSIVNIQQVNARYMLLLTLNM